MGTPHPDICHFPSLSVPTILLSTLTYGLSISHDLLMVLLAVEFKGEKGRANKELGGAHVEKMPVRF